MGISPQKAADSIAGRHQKGVPSIRRRYEVDEEGRKVGWASSSAQGDGNIDGKSAQERSEDCHAGRKARVRDFTGAGLSEAC